MKESEIYLSKKELNLLNHWTILRNREVTYSLSDTRVTTGDKSEPAFVNWPTYNIHKNRTILESFVFTQTRVSRHNYTFPRLLRTMHINNDVRAVAAQQRLPGNELLPQRELCGALPQLSKFFDIDLLPLYSIKS